MSLSKSASTQGCGYHESAPSDKLERGLQLALEACSNDQFQFKKELEKSCDDVADHET